MRPIHTLNRFTRDTGGSAVVDAMIWLPVMIFAWLTVFGIWDIYRDRMTTQKATFVAADILSREMVTINNAYLDTLGRIVDRLSATGMTVTKSFAAYRRNADGSVTLIWAYAPANNGTALTQNDLNAMAATLPAIRTKTTAIIVKSSASYSRTLTAPVSNLLFSGSVSSTIVLQPRFQTAICLNTSPC